MQAFVGTKLIKAEPMSECKFLSEVKGQPLSPGQDDREGYLVVYPNPEGDYKSWSPKEVFEQAYRPLSDREVEFVTE